MKKSVNSNNAVNSENVAPALEETNEVVLGVATDEINATGETVVTLEELLGLQDEADLPEDNAEYLPVVETYPRPALPPKSDSKIVVAQVNIEYRIKSLKRTIDHKKYSREHEQAKVADWRIQAAHRDASAHDEYTRRKAELEAQLIKNDDRYNKRITKTKTHWWDYCTNYEETKIKKFDSEIELLEKELEKLESAPVVEVKVTEVKATEVTANEVSSTEVSAPEVTATEELTTEVSAPEEATTELKAA